MTYTLTASAIWGVVGDKNPDDIIDWGTETEYRLGGASGTSDRGETNFRINAADFIISDNTLSGFINWFWRSTADNKIYIGSQTLPVETRSDFTVSSVFTVEGNSVLQGSVTLQGTNPKIDFIDNQGTNQTSGEVGINPTVNGVAEFGAMGLVLYDDGAQPDRAIVLRTSNSEAPLWVVGANEYTIVTTNIPAGGVGSTVFARNNSGATLDFGDTTSGSNLAPSQDNTTVSTATLSGTWSCLGYAQNTRSTMFMRIA